MEYILSLSYGKDSLACLGAIEQLGWPLDQIVHAEVFATDTIPADLPPMVEFKAKADKIIMERYRIEVEHVRSKRSYNDIFYMVCGGSGRKAEKSKNAGNIYGWPFQRGPWCNSIEIGVMICKSESNSTRRFMLRHGWTRRIPTASLRDSPQP